MDTPNFYNTLENFSLKYDNPEGAWGCYGLLTQWLGGVPQETFSKSSSQTRAFLEGGYESRGWPLFMEAMAKLTQKNGLARMEGWWTALLWCGELPGSTIMPKDLQLPE
jgi:hypothetical protein